MQMTLTLDDEVAAELKRLRRDEGERFDAAVNDLLRRELRQLKPFRTRSVLPGKPKLSNVDNITEAVAFAEGKDFK
jgi:hypothetical protein